MSNQILILQSRANLTWALSVNNCHIQFLVGLSGMCAPTTTPAKGVGGMGGVAGGHLGTLGTGRWQPPRCEPS